MTSLRMTTLVAILLLAAAPAFAVDQHHQESTTNPDQSGPVVAQQSDAGTRAAVGQPAPTRLAGAGTMPCNATPMMGATMGQGGMPGQSAMPGQGNMMSMMMDMMGQAEMMGQSSTPRQPGMMSAGNPDTAMMSGGMTDRLEGRIAFVAAELKITETQQKTWNQFADALRANAKRLADVQGAMMQNKTAATLADRLDQRQRSLSAMLEGTTAVKATFDHLYGVLSDEQRKTAEELPPMYLVHIL